MNNMIQEEEQSFQLRLPLELHGEIKEIARAERQSMNALIIKAVEQLLDPSYSIRGLTTRMEAAGLIQLPASPAAD